MLRPSSCQQVQSNRIRQTTGRAINECAHGVASTASYTRGESRLGRTPRSPRDAEANSPRCRRRLTWICSPNGHHGRGGVSVLPRCFPCSRRRRVKGPSRSLELSTRMLDRTSPAPCPQPAPMSRSRSLGRRCNDTAAHVLVLPLRNADIPRPKSLAANVPRCVATGPKTTS